MTNLKLSFLFSLVFIGLLYASLQRIPFKKWPQIKINSGRILLAKGNLAHQGFAGAKASNFKKTLIFFPNIHKGIEFVNYDQGYGVVIKTLAVIFMDNKWNVLKISIMKKETGTAIAPPKTSFVFECLPLLAQRLKFKEGKPSPIKINTPISFGLGPKHLIHL